MRVFTPLLYLLEYISLDVRDELHDGGPKSYERSELLRIGLENEHPARPWGSLHSLPMSVIFGVTVETRLKNKALERYHQPNFRRTQEERGAMKRDSNGQVKPRQKRFKVFDPSERHLRLAETSL